MNKSAIMKLIKNIHKNTPATGMKDDVPASINGNQPAALSEGEYVIDAQTVSLLGDGNTDAGAKILDSLVKEIRRIKMGKTQQPAPLDTLIKDGRSK